VQSLAWAAGFQNGVSRALQHLSGDLSYYYLILNQQNC